jgi:hypothetical protein
VIAISSLLAMSSSRINLRPFGYRALVLSDSAPCLLRSSSDRSWLGSRAAEISFHSTECPQFLRLSQFGSANGSFQHLDRLIVKEAIHGIGDSILAPMRKSESGRILIAGFSSILNGGPGQMLPLRCFPLCRRNPSKLSCSEGTRQRRVLSADAALVVVTTLQTRPNPR